MKKPKSKQKTAKTPTDLWAPFPKRIEDWTDEDRALEWLLRSLRVSLRSAKSSLPLPPMIYVPAMKMFFDWLAKEISENQNQDAVERLYYLTHLAVENLSVASFSRPELFRPIAKLQLHWPSVTGWDADTEKINKELMTKLNLGENAPLNTARDGRKSFSILENPPTGVAYSLWRVIEFFRREEQGIYSGDPACPDSAPGVQPAVPAAVD